MTTKQKRLYDSARWRKSAKFFLSIHPLCVFCEKLGKLTPATVVDHITPHDGNYGLFWNPENWQPLCAACHSGAKRVKENQGIMPGCDVLGNPLDENHPWNKEK